MASKLKGITIEIGGNTEPLQKSLDGVNKKSRSLQVELRQVERLLKLDPSNTELLVQKQNLLADSISATSQKLDGLKAAESQVQAQFERGEIVEEQYRAFQREIIKTENELNQMRTSLQVATRNLNEFGDNNGVAREEAERLNRSIVEQNESLQAERQALRQAKEAQKQHAEEVNKAKKEVEEYKDKVEEAADKIKTAFIASGAAVATTTIGISTYSTNLVNDFDKAFNTLITKTGATEDELESLNLAMEKVYVNNFGESIEDVANSMAIVKTNTKLTGDELELATERAILLRDTFEFEINESTRSAKMLMDQFGLSAEQSYNLIAQGAQKGLDKNGDLLDTINEYAVHFKQLGFDAEDMFNMLVNGAESGTFSVDKLGDSVKEFGIRVKDGTAENAFKKLGFDVDETTQKFGKGGDTAKEALTKVTTALFNMDEPIQQNILGVEMFGTMWEDLGVDGVKSLMNLQGEISTTSTALEDINNTKYDDIGSALNGLGRELQVSVIKPIGEDLQPLVEDSIEYVKKNSPEIKKILLNLFDGTKDFVKFVVKNGDEVISTISGIGAGFVTWKVTTMISGLVSAIKALKTANEGAAVSQKILNLAMSSNVVGLLATAVAGLVAGLATLIITQKDEQNELSETGKRIKETSDSYKELKESQEENINTGLTEIGYTQNLWKELQTLADSNGTVINKNKDRAQFILGELNEALGTEYTMTGNQIDKYDELSGSIDTLIAKKKAMIILEAQEPAYKDAILNLEKQQIDTAKAKQEMQEVEMALIEKKDKLEETTSGANRNRLLMEISKLEDNLDKKKGIYETSKGVLEGYYSDISTYENNAVLIEKGNIEDLEQVYSSYGQVIKDHTTTNKEELEKQMNDYQLAYAEISKAYREGVEGVTLDMVNEARERAVEAKKAFEEAGAESVQGTINGMNSKKQSFVDDVTDTATKGRNTFNSNFTNQLNYAGSTAISNATQGVNSQKGAFAGAMLGIGSSGKSGINNALNNMNSIGIRAINDVLTGANNKRGGLNTTMSSIGSEGRRILQNNIQNTYGIGVNIVDGVKSGVENNKGGLFTSLKSLALGALNSAKVALGIHSPSRVFRDMIGKNISLGIAEGIKEEHSSVEDELNNNLNNLVSTSKLSSLNRSINKTFSSKNNSTSNVSTGNTSIPQTAVFNIILEGQIIGEIAAPFVDVINGAKIEFKGRGLNV